MTGDSRDLFDLHLPLFPRFPQIQPDDLKLVIEEIAVSNPKARGADPATFIDERVARGRKIRVCRSALSIMSNEHCVMT
jgi:hypothetical protein